MDGLSDKGVLSSPGETPTQRKYSQGCLSIELRDTFYWNNSKDEFIYHILSKVTGGFGHALIKEEEEENKMEKAHVDWVAKVGGTQWMKDLTG